VLKLLNHGQTPLWKAESLVGCPEIALLFKKVNTYNLVYIYCFYSKKRLLVQINELDRIDLTILRLLQQDGRLSNPQLAEHVSLSVTPCWRRLKRLESEGFITDYQANLNRRKLGLGILAFIQLSFVQATDASVKPFEQMILLHPAVVSCHKITGQSDYMLQVVAADLDAYSEFIEKVLRAVPGVGSIHSSLAMREIKSSSRLPVPEPAAG
jgi:Lrp/AsnC family transcriptional regulator, leucine-responsive regulatory protein